METFFDVNKYLSLKPDEQLLIIVNLLQVSYPEVKYKFQTCVKEITKYDIISGVPHEISEKIFLQLDLKSLLCCRQVSKQWNNSIHGCNTAWLPFLKSQSIKINGFSAVKTHSPQLLKKKDGNMQIIGERLFELSHSDVPFHGKSFEVDTNSNAFSYIMGRKLLVNLKNQANFQLIIDHDSRGSNVSMAMDSDIVAYAREDRHVVIKYSSFPHKKINIFEAHQCADLKIHNDLLITAGYDRMINIWKWRTGELVACLEGSTKPVYSIDIAGDILLSSDGKDIITWDLKNNRILVMTRCFDNQHIQEVKAIDPEIHGLQRFYKDFLLVTRSNSQLKVWKCSQSGVLSFLAELVIPNKKINSFQPFLQVHKANIACSSECGVCVWNLIDFTLLRCIPQKLCPPCKFNQQIPLQQTPNCRVILLYYSDQVMMHYLVHKNKFQLLGVQVNSKMKVNWKFPSDEKWPWSHRKPGIACSIMNTEDGLSMNTKISMFVSTQAKKIYCAFFDASDFDFDASQEISDIESYSKKHWCY